MKLIMNMKNPFDLVLRFIVALIMLIIQAVLIWLLASILEQLKVESEDLESIKIILFIAAAYFATHTAVRLNIGE